MIPAQAKHGKPGLPWLVFLHGFLAIAMNGKKWARRLPTTRGCMLISQVTVVQRRSASMDLMMSPAYCVKTLVKLRQHRLTSGWWGTSAWRTGGDDGGLPGAGGDFVGVVIEGRASWIAKC